MCCSYRWEAHIWVKELGRQVYLGGYEHQEHAAEAYDVAALKCKGFRVKTNFDAARCVMCSCTMLAAPSTKSRSLHDAKECFMVCGESVWHSLALCT